MTKLSLSIALAGTALFAFGCADDPSVNGNCEGEKCDVFDGMLDLIREDRASVPISKLVEQGAPAFEKLACTELSRVIARDVQAHSEEDLDALVSGLTERFGNSDLSTRVNEVRRNHLGSSGDRVYLEADAEFETDIGTAFSLSAGGFDGSVSLGFAGAGLGYRFITAMDDEPSGLVDKFLPDTLNEICDERDFLIPQSVADLRNMKEGDLVALHGDGFLGINLGLNVPILIGDPVAFASYSAVLNVGYSNRMEGEIDTQVVRLDNNSVVLDVGITNARVREKSLRLSDDWGIQSFCGEAANVDCDFELFGNKLTDIVDGAVEEMLDEKLNVFEVAAEKTNSEYRMSVARIRLDLDAAQGEEVERAVQQAMVGDLRLMQALAYRSEQGVNVEFDLLRTGVSATSSFGVDIFGSSLYKRRVAEDVGSVVVQTPGGVNSIFFDSFHKSGGWGSSDRGYTRVGIGGIQFNTASNAAPEGDANLIIQVMQSHGSLKADKLLDHIDGAIIGLAGLEGLKVIEEHGNDLMRQVDEQCEEHLDVVCPSGSAINCNRSRESNTCTEMVFEQNPTILQDIEARSDADIASVTRDLSPSKAALVRAAAQARFKAQACYSAHRYGPRGTIVSDFRLDDAALAHITQPNMEDAFEQSVHNFLGASEIAREQVDFASERAEVLANDFKKLDAMKAAYAEFSARYRAIGSVEKASLERFGSPAVEIQLSGADATDGLEKMTVSSLASARARAATRLFDEIKKAGDGFFGDLGPKSEFTVAYGLLGMVPAESVDLRVDVDFDDNKALYQDVCNMGFGFDETAKGGDVSPIKAGSFELDNLIGLSITRDSDPEDPDA